jgi:hypothetical protein
MAYVGTLLGAIGAFGLSSWPPPMSGRAAGCASPCAASASFAAPVPLLVFALCS